MSVIEPQAYPEVIEKRKDSIVLFCITTVALSIVVVAPVLGSVILPFWGLALPNEIWPFAVIALYALADTVAKRREQATT